MSSVLGREAVARPDREARQTKGRAVGKGKLPAATQASVRLLRLLSPSSAAWLQLRGIVEIPLGYLRADPGAQGGRGATRLVRPYTLGEYGIKQKKANGTMSHVAAEKQKLLNRLKRIRGQIDALERAVDGDVECVRVLQQATACRGALEGFIAEVIEDHIREHIIDPQRPADDPRAQAAEELVAIIKAYLR
jgi:DNA-binding FrmR family transcriptional regulator